MQPFSVLILAGQRKDVVDPLCEHAGVSHKALVPICGKIMIDYVLTAIGAVPKSGPIFISGFDINSLADIRSCADADIENISQPVSIQIADLKQAPSGDGPADSAALAIESGINLPCLITTCDHALLTPDIITEFIEKAEKEEGDFFVGFASKDVISAQYPTTKRTYLKFSDIDVSGCNLFYIKSKKGVKAIEFWREAQDLRKKPLKLALKIGFSIGARYLLGRLSLKSAFKYASKRLNIKAKPILISIAQAAIDVDKPDDKILVEGIIKARSVTAHSKASSLSENTAPRLSPTEVRPK